MTTSDEDPEICKTCHHTRLWHDTNKPIHPFNSGQAGATAFLNRRGDRTPGSGRDGAPRPTQGPPMLPSDPVLRVALLNAGILTPADLAAAEEQLRTAFINQGRQPWLAPGEESSASSTGTDRTSTELSDVKERPKP
jgi:hypothetical protein